MVDITPEEARSKDIDILVREARAADPSIDTDPKKALELLVIKLTYGTGFYLWNHMDGQWFVRLPRTDLPDEHWLKKARAELVHICNPIQYLLCVERQAPKEDTVKHIGYSRGETKDADTACTRCDTKCPTDIAHRSRVIVKLGILGQKIK